jgi:squalene-associated FAD-dependent desaturase
MDVVLFERSRLLGGKATSFEVEGVEVDNGQHVILACCTEFIDLVSDLRMSSVLHLQERFRAIILARGQPPSQLVAAPLPAPLHLIPSFTRYRHVDALGKLQIAWALLAARRRGSARHSETFAQWLDRHHQGASARRGFWDPFMIPALNAPLDEVSAEDALFVIRTAFLGDPGAARFGFATVPLVRIAEAAAQRCDEVRLRTPVSGLQVEEGRVRALVLEDGTSVKVDAAVLAVPPRRLSRILESAPEVGVGGLDSFRTQPIVDVHLWYDRPVAGFDFAALLGSPVQWVFVKGQGYLCCSLSAAGDQVTLPEDELVELCHRELQTVLPTLSSVRPIRGAATRDPEATFICAPGLRRPGAVTSIANLAIAGAWTDTGWPATMESAVRSGRTAARVLAEGMMARPLSSRATAMEASDKTDKKAGSGAPLTAPQKEVSRRGQTTAVD